MAKILKVSSVEPQAELISEAAQLVLAGEVVAIPTDTFYGLAADPFNPAACEKVFAAKGRPSDKPLLLLIGSREMAEDAASELPDIFHVLAEKFWPGPLTIVVSAAANLPAVVTAGTGTIGLRLPKAPIAQALIRAAGLPVTATSANLTGQPDSSSAAQVAEAMGERLPLILDGGPSPASKPSTVVSVIGGECRILREGAISGQEIEAFLPKVFRG